MPAHPELLSVIFKLASHLYYQSKAMGAIRACLQELVHFTCFRENQCDGLRTDYMSKIGVFQHNHEFHPARDSLHGVWVVAVGVELSFT